MELTQEELDKKIADGVEAAVTKATAKLVEKNTEVIGKLNKAKQDAKDIEAAKAKEIEDAIQEGLKKDGKHDELINRLTEQHSTSLIALETKLAESNAKELKATGDLRELMIDKGLADQFLAAGVTDPTLLEAAVALSSRNAEIVDDDDGKPQVMISGANVADFMKEWTEGKGKAFISAGDFGGNAGGTGENKAGDWEVHFKPETENATKQLELKNSNASLFDTLSKKYAPKDLPLTAPR